jgi:hypothetical protein
MLNNSVSLWYIFNVMFLYRIIFIDFLFFLWNVYINGNMPQKEPCSYSKRQHKTKQIGLK